MHGCVCLNLIKLPGLARRQPIYPFSFPLEHWIREGQLVYFGLYTFSFFWGAPLDLSIGLEFILFFFHDLIALLQKLHTLQTCRSLCGSLPQYFTGVVWAVGSIEEKNGGVSVSLGMV